VLCICLPVIAQNHTKRLQSLPVANLPYQLFDFKLALFVVNKIFMHKAKFYYLIFSVLTLGTVKAQELSSIKNQKPFELKGGLDLRGIYYNAQGISSRYKPTSYVLSGNPVLSFYGFKVPISFTVGNQGKNFRQPFNQFGASPSYKKLKLHAGYRNINFNPYTLGGHTMLGAGLEATPGKLRLGFMYGRLNKATALDPTTLNLQPVTFSRLGWAAKIGLGTASNFFDISVLKAKDDANSLDNEVLKKYYNSTRPSVFAANNLALGLNFRFTVAKNLFFEGDAGSSLYTRDSKSGIAIGEENTSILNTLKKVVNVNGTSGFYTAFQSGIRYKAKNFGLKINYRRIDPDYKTMGAYFFQNDIQNITLAPNFSVFKNKIRFNASAGLQQDNLKKLKTATSKKIIALGNLGMDFTKNIGLDISYSNFNNNQTPTTVRFADTLRITQTTENLSIMPRFMFMGPKINHVIMLSGSVMKLDDFNNFYASDALSRNMNNQNYFANYSLTFNEMGLTVYSNLNSSTLEAANIKESNQGLTLGGSKGFLKNKLNANFSAGYILGDRNAEKSTITNSNLQVSYQVSKNHRLSLNGMFLNTKPKSETSSIQKFSETRAEIGYGFNF
jgi:hypothetical protein